LPGTVTRNSVFCSVGFQDTLFIARHDGVIQCLDSLSGKLLRGTERDFDAVNAIDISADRTRVAAVTANRKVRLYDLQTLRLLKQFPYVRQMEAVFFTDDDERLVISNGNQLYMFNPRTGQTVLALPTEFSTKPCATSADRKSIAGQLDNHLKIIQLE
jgi:WD40 repeat protein